jgi:hypothetical protein
MFTLLQTTRLNRIMKFKFRVGTGVSHSVFRDIKEYQGMPEENLKMD